MAQRRKTMTNLLKSLWTDESGQTMAEYALLLALIAVVCIAALLLLGPKIADVFNYVKNQLTDPA